MRAINFLCSFVIGKVENQAMSTTSILDLPTEIIQTFIFKYLDDIDIYNLGEAGSKRLKEISQGTIAQLGKL